MPNFVDSIHDSREDVGDLLVGGLASAEVAIVPGVEGDVASVDGPSGLKGRFDFCQRAPALNLAAKQFRIVGAVNVHLEIGLVGQYTSLPVLFKVLRGHHSDRLHFHGLKTQGDDIVHSFNDGSTLTREWNACWSEFD